MKAMVDTSLPQTFGEVVFVFGWFFYFSLELKIKKKLLENIVS